MTAWLRSLFVSIFGNNSALATFLISMIPIIELRGAIPFGTAHDLWGEYALSLPMSLLFSVLPLQFLFFLQNSQLFFLLFYL